MKRLWILLILFCIIGLLFGTVCNGQSFHANQQIDHVDTLKIDKKISPITFEYSNGRMIKYFPRHNVEFNDCLYEETNYGFIVETNDSDYEWYLDTFNKRVLMIIEKPYYGIVDKRVFSIKPYNNVTRKH